jgi:hypothetical protein
MKSMKFCDHPALGVISLMDLPDNDTHPQSRAAPLHLG